MKIALALLLSLSLVACGDDDDDDSNDGGRRDGDASTTPPITFAAYCDGFVDWYWTSLNHCYGDGPYPASGAAELKDNFREACLRAQPGVASGRLRFDGAVAADCIAALATVKCTQQPETITACDGVFESTVAEGASCYDAEARFFGIGGSSCANGLCAGDECPGHCIPYPELGAPCVFGQCAPEHACNAMDRCEVKKAEGEPCDGAFCADELACAMVSGALRCTRVAQEGEACSETLPCSGPATCSSGTCKVRVAVGEGCYLDEQCPNGTFCSGEGDARTCRAPGAVGAACTQDKECDPAVAVCSRRDGSAGTCLALPSVGSPCDNSGRCAPGAWCHHTDSAPNGLCESKGARGADCFDWGIVPTTSGCQTSLYCVRDGTCQPAGAMGEPCAVFELESCREGLYCTRETATCIPPSARDAQCNPFWPNTCQMGLGCHCGATGEEACGSTPPESTPTDTCKPLLEAGADCTRERECASEYCQPNESGRRVCIEPTPECVGPSS